MRLWSRNVAAICCSGAAPSRSDAAKLRNFRQLTTYCRGSEPQRCGRLLRRRGKKPQRRGCCAAIFAHKSRSGTEKSRTGAARSCNAAALCLGVAAICSDAAAQSRSDGVRTAHRAAVFRNVPLRRGSFAAGCVTPSARSCLHRANEGAQIASALGRRRMPAHSGGRLRRSGDSHRS